LQITKVWSCERFQGRYRYSMEGLWPVNQAQPAWNCELELGFPQCRPGKWWPVTGSRISLFILMLVRGSVL